MQSNRGRYYRGLFALSCLFLATYSSLPVQAASNADLPSDVVFQPSASSSQLSLIEGSTRILQLPKRIKSVHGFDGTIVTVKPLDGVANQVQLISQTPGLTTVILTDEQNNVFKIDVHVVGDTRQLEAHLREAFPESNIKATKIKDAVELRGWANRAEDVPHIIEVAEQFFPKVLNHVEVIGVQQVSLRAKIMEIQRGKIRQMGFNFFAVGEQGYLASTPGALTPIKSLSLPFGGPPSIEAVSSSFTNSQLSFGLTQDDFIFQGFLEALKTQSLLKILAEPELVTVNGRPADFLSGGEFPVLVPQSLGTVSVQYKQFGVQLKFIPYILGQGRLRLEIEPEVSERDNANAITLNGNTIPALTTRRVQTQVEMNFGQTLAIAGLINGRSTEQAFKVPYLGDMPWIGAAFRRVKDDTAETELLILVTPELVAPMSAETAPQDGPGSSTSNPTDKELYWKGFLEVPNVGDDCPNCYGNNYGYQNNSNYYSNSYSAAPTMAPTAESGPTYPPLSPPATEEGSSSETAPAPTGVPAPPPETTSRWGSNRIRQVNGQTRTDRSSTGNRTSTSARSSTSMPGLIGPPAEKSEKTATSSSSSSSRTRVTK
ncbi:MAG: pilus assembly protein N-terminal domain-containing protein [Planctomycetaceae bacterium]|nr:pilus assembly protein N-terminal domain-containing protein [Planctomycetaceae bacterium]